MNTSLNLVSDPIDRDAQRVAHDLDAVSSRRPTLLARAAHRTWRAVVRQWHVQQFLQDRALQI